MSAAWQAALAETVQRLQSEQDAIAGVLLTSAKKTFFAGAELNELMKLTRRDAQQFFHEIEAMKKHMRALDLLGKPVEVWRHTPP